MDSKLGGEGRKGMQGREREKVEVECDVVVLRDRAGKIGCSSQKWVS